MATWGRPAGDETDSDDDDFMIDYESAQTDAVEFKQNVASDENVRKKLVQQKSLEMAEIAEELRIAIMRGNLITTQEILEAGFGVDTILKSGWTALMYGSVSSNFDIVLYLLSKGANPNFEKDQFTPLMSLCSSQSLSDKLVPCCERLIHLGANVNASEKQRMTPLMFASKGGRLELVKLLIKHGAKVNEQDNRGWPALVWAATHGHGKIVKILLENEADPKIQSFLGESITELAKSHGYLAISEIIEKYSGSDCSSSLLESLPVKEEQLLETKKDSTSQKFKRYGDLDIFLSGLDLAHLLPIFEEQQITFQTFLTLTEEDLDSMGIRKLGERKTILDNIKRVHKKKWEESSLDPVQSRKYLSCPDVYAILENISKHISYIDSTIKYMSKKIKVNPRDLEIGKDTINIISVVRQAKQAVDHTEQLQNELKRFHSQLEKVDVKNYFLSSSEEFILFQHYQFYLRDFCRRFQPPMPKYVVGTSFNYFKRFYLRNSVMDYHPYEIVMTCIYLATKVEEFNISIAQFVANVKRDQEKIMDIILNNELLLMQQLNYHLTIHNPYRPVEGFMIDIKTRCPFIKDPEILRPAIDEFLDHSFLTDACLLYPPSQIALAAIFSAANKLQENLKGYIKNELLEPDEDDEMYMKLADSLEKISKIVKKNGSSTVRLDKRHRKEIGEM